MRYYILTTVKFANECIENSIYGATNSNWLANIEIGDFVFISQFNYKSQNIYGPFKVVETLFYDKNIIYPNQKYYYRIKINAAKSKIIDETDLYLSGIKNGSMELAYYIINLIQQNKHLHSMSLTDKEGKFIFHAIEEYGKKTKIKTIKDYSPDFMKHKVDAEFLTNKNNLFKKLSFSSEGDLETFILLGLKNKDNHLYKQFNDILNTFQKNYLDKSKIYNQFILGNAYPTDMVILNKENINIFELKKDCLSQNLFSTLRKEMRKYCYYSLFSHRIENQKNIQMNFFLLTLRGGDERLKRDITIDFSDITNPIDHIRKNNFTMFEYFIDRKQMIIEKKN